MPTRRGPGRPRKKRGPGRTTPDLSYEERIKIRALLTAGHTRAEIAYYLNRSRSCIGREINRGLCEQKIKKRKVSIRYEPDFAEKCHATAQSKKGRKLKIGSDHETAAALDRYVIEERYSPAAAVMKAAANGEMKTRIARSTYYEYIHKGVTAVEEKHLRYGFNPRKKEPLSFEQRRTSRHVRAGESIEHRPKHVLRRREFGHWEGDLVIGARKAGPAILTLVERKTRMLFATKISDTRTSSVVDAFDRIERKLGSLIRPIFKSITFDNGHEFRDADGIKRSIEQRDPGGERIGKIYYAHPYCSSERGSNENINRMLRIAFPKGTDFSTVSDDELACQVLWINNYPRAILNGKCAEECFEKELNSLLTD